MSSLTAQTADKHRLYESSVQNPEEEVRFIREVYKKRYGKNPILLREDFCGTATVCSRWVQSSPQCNAIGVDLDPSVLEWGRRHNLSALGKAASRVDLIHGNVLTPREHRPHVVTAMNFSYFVFKTRAELLNYYRQVYEALDPQGVLLIDIYGGPEAQVAQEEETEYDDYSYVWDQDYFDPVTGEYRCYIHFRFPDGSEIRKAFSYDWRLWSLTEVQDLLTEAGFADVTVYWEGEDEDGEGNGIFRPVNRGEDDAAWIAYVVGSK